MKIFIEVVISQVVKMGSMKNFHSLLDTLPLLANPIEESVPGESDFQNRFLTWLVEETIDLKCDWWSRCVDQLAIDQVAVVDWFEMSGVATYETEQPWVCEQQHMLYSCQAMVILWFDINQIV